MRLTSAILTAAVAAALGAAVSCQSDRQASLLAHVNPFVGTDFTGNTYPGAQAPFGMVQLSPDNGTGGWDRIAGYFYPDSTIAGFSHTHLDGTGAGDLYDISFMPVALPLRVAAGELGIHSRFSHSREDATAGYYHVYLDDYDVDVRLTATERCGVQHYAFKRKNSASAVVLNLNKALNWDRTVATHIEVVDERTVRGYRYSDGWARGQKVYFCTRFSQPWTRMANIADTLRAQNVIAANVVADGGECDIWQFDFDTSASGYVNVSTALSPTGMDQAQANLEAEVPDDDFDAVCQATGAAWDKALGVIEVTAPEGQQDDVNTFYTALYHSMIAPTIYGDADGSYLGPDGKTHRAIGWTNYSTFSLWDTYRAAHPLFTLTQPERVKSMARSLLVFYEQSGRLPVWNMWAGETDMMIGYHSVPVIVDAYLKGLLGEYDANKALEACVATACQDHYRGIGYYRQHGYVPYDLDDGGVNGGESDWSLSKTLEYAYDDWCIARLAETLGKQQIAETFYRRAQNYRNVYNPATGWMQPRAKDGSWQRDFCPDEYTPHICESNAWHYFFSVQHDTDGLCQLMGGKQKMAARLDSMFTHTPADKKDLPLFSTGMIGQYAHGNEPSHHVIYLYNKVGQPWKTQELAAKVMHTLYKNEPAGLCGNEDCGQTSAWFVMSAMGLYPVNPCSGEYEIGSPLFTRMTLHLGNGKNFTIEAPEASHRNIYVQSVKLNGKPYNSSSISHQQIMRGGTLTLQMGAKPAPAWYE